MKKLIFLSLMLFAILHYVHAQECKPINIDGTSEVMVNEERQNYLVRLPSPMTKSQEVMAVNIMRKLAFAKYADDGCYVRAHVLGDQLAKAGIVDTYKTWLFAPSHYTFFLNGSIKPLTGKSAWNYHVALSFVGSDGTHMIMDSAVESQRAISYDEWLSKLRCTSGSLMLRTDRIRWLPATVTTEDKIPQKDYYGHGRNPFNGFIFSQDASTPDMVSNHLARDDAADKFVSCSLVSGESASSLLKRLTSGDVPGDKGCAGIVSYFNERQRHWKSLFTAPSPIK
jgi:hypothetical protein